MTVSEYGLALMAAADAHLFTQWNFVTRMLMLGVFIAIGWIPVALVIIAVAVRPQWATFIALGVVGAVILAALFAVVWVPNAEPANGFGAVVLCHFTCDSAGSTVHFTSLG
ncbi:hypothetical protein ASF88_06825 [Leifsonia sp. Leaf336]|uniref:hypothetical protein n=1 Tax=Leifsonia sp. Leaf336 TaxID=1736341 RepID=UPI0006F2C8D2|nr:hypothetical protein [Leifsonia sp. Leaf336]KQR54488.1 hypothetical protein ASF88_06825 [Leifsonia sp. Leaf336]